MMCLEQRVKEALAISASMVSDSDIDRDDVAQEAVLRCACNLMSETWKQDLCKATKDIIRQQRKRLEEQRHMKENYKEWLMIQRRTNQVNKAWLRELIQAASTPREWQVLHRIYWRVIGQEEIGVELNISQQAVSKLHVSGLQHTRDALRRHGLSRKNIWQWYYGETDVPEETM